MEEFGKHVLLGAGGPIANSLAKTLLERRQDVRLVSRRGYALPNAEVVKADLLDPAAMKGAVLPGSTVYLLPGLTYSVDVWTVQWPRIMHNAIQACTDRGARLMFFDNVYMYGRVDGPMTESTPVNPCSRKGEVRSRIAAELLDATKAGRLKACIARSADFYGPGAGNNSVPHFMIFQRLARGKAPQWIGDATQPHSFTYTPDCGPAIALLAESDDAWGQVWHLPTAAPPLTGNQFIELAARAFGREPRLSLLRPWMVHVGGLFNPLVHEVVEMLYQNTAPYLFDSTKFETRFAFTPTPYASGIAAAVAAVRKVRS